MSFCNTVCYRLGYRWCICFKRDTPFHHSCLIILPQPLPFCIILSAQAFVHRAISWESTHSPKYDGRPFNEHCAVQAMKTIVDHLAYKWTSGFFALRALTSHQKLTHWSITDVNWMIDEWLSVFTTFVLFLSPIAPFVLFAPCLSKSPTKGWFHQVWEPLLQLILAILSSSLVRTTAGSFLWILNISSFFVLLLICLLFRYNADALERVWRETVTWRVF